MRQLKKLICLNLALLMLLSVCLPTVAFAAETGMTDTVTLTVGGQTYTLSEYENASGNGWGANVFSSSNKERSWWGVRVSLRGDVGPISVDATGSNVEELEIRTTNESSITAQSGAAITASGFDCLTMEGEKTLRVTGQPAVKLDEDMTFMLTHSNLTLEGTNGAAAYEARVLSTDEDNYALTETKNESGTVTKLVCKYQTVTLTLKDWDGAAGKANTKTIVCKKNKYIDLSNVFWQTGSYLTGWSDDAAGQKYTRGIIPTEDMELWADWYALAAVTEKSAVFNTASGIVAVDASEDGWVAPVVAHDEENNVYAVAWKTEIQPEGETVYAAQGTGNKALTRGLFFDGCVGNNSSHGIFYVGNGRTIGGGGSETIPYTEEPTTLSWTMDDGSVLIGWNTQPDGSGTSYAASGAEVDGADTGWVILYAQTLPKGTIEVRWWDNVTGSSAKDNITYAKAGDTLTMPERTVTNAKVNYWSYSYWNGSGYTWGKVKAGETFTIPEGATDLSLTANWIPTKPFTVDGREYTVTDENMSFGSEELGMDVSLFYNNYSNQFQMNIYGENVKSMHFPVDTLIGSNVSGAKINGTISCDGMLTINCACADGVHAGLTIDGGSGPALKAEKIRILRAPHLTLTGGTSAIEGTVSMVPSAGTIFCDESGSELALTALSGKKKLTTKAQTVALTIDGNGGTSKKGNATEKITLEVGERYRLEKLGFAKAQACLNGIEGSTESFLVYNYITAPMEDGTLRLRWHEVGYDYIAFQASGTLAANSLQKDQWEKNHAVIFAANGEGNVTAPDVVYSNRVSSGDLLYWYTENEDGSKQNQYLPGETVTETSGTTLYAASKWCGECCYILHTNGRKVEGVKDEANKLLVRERCEALVSKDGYVCDSFNTEPDGTGTRYEIGTVATNPDETPVLYAQWTKKVTATVTETKKPAAAETAPDGTKPTETDKNTQITITQVAPAPGEGGGETTQTPIEDSRTEAEVKQDFEMGRKVLIAAYQDGKMMTVLVGEVKDGKITCVIPWWLDYENCQLKLLVVNGVVPERAAEIIKISETSQAGT